VFILNYYCRYTLIEMKRRTYRKSRLEWNERKYELDGYNYIRSYKTGKLMSHLTSSKSSRKPFATLQQCWQSVAECTKTLQHAFTVNIDEHNVYPSSEIKTSSVTWDRSKWCRSRATAKDHVVFTWGIESVGAGWSRVFLSSGLKSFLCWTPRPRNRLLALFSRTSNPFLLFLTILV
jgi:hypothetical protein